MEMRHIRYFLTVAAEHNFTRAAERVGIGQPSLSLQIRDLERAVGARLFHRIPQGAALTEAGKAFHHLVRNIPDHVERAKQLARRAARAESGALTVGYTNASELNPVFSASLRSYRRAFPGVTLSLKESHTTQLIDGLLNGELDVVFVRPIEADAEHLKIRLISEEPLMAVLPINHPAAQMAKLNLSDLRDESFILPRREDTPSLFDTVIAACRKAGFDPTLGPSVPQLVTIVQLVAADIGVSLVAASLQEFRITGVVFKELHDVFPTTRLSIAWRRTDTSPFLRNFLASAFG
jgi:DNA-binding transcriptional LysR family regulator